MQMLNPRKNVTNSTAYKAPLPQQQTSHFR